ncbi:lysostaphin resistance A-like protein [uncultured Methylobacterium sp.]|uniref:CPBP family intramembrane glutamic endopeptidase n=1 Tax=uncultured Methylobacterium sp. TaxID=157278 RepID=UPI0035CA5261
MPDLATPDAVIAAASPERAPSFGVRLLGLGAITLLALLYLAVASVLALILVRVGGDLIDGIDPFLAQNQRPRLFPRQLALRELAVDILRQVLLAALVVGTVLWRDRGGWRRTLGFARGTTAPGLPAGRLLMILLAWPFLHILWVTATAELFAAPFARHVTLARGMPPSAVAAWLLYVTLLAPVAEEILMRGEIFAKARRFLGPAGAIVATALLFAFAHVSQAGIARPVSLLPLALMLGWLRWRTDRLWPCIVLHGWSNLAILVYVLWPSPT